MPRLPAITPKQLLAALKKNGFEVQRQKGSHVYLWHPEKDRIAVVPMHGRDLPRGTLMAIVKQAGLSIDTLRDLL